MHGKRATRKAIGEEPRRRRVIGNFVSGGSFLDVEMRWWNGPPRESLHDRQSVMRENSGNFVAFRKKIGNVLDHVFARKKSSTTLLFVSAP